MEQQVQEKRFLKRVVLVAAIVLLVLHFGQVLQMASKLVSICLPLFLGFIIAYIINMFMQFLGRHYFPKAKGRWREVTKKPVCLLLSFVLIGLLLVAVVNLVLPQIINTLTSLAAIFPFYFEKIRLWLVEHEQEWPIVAQWINASSLRWDDLMPRIVGYATQGISGILNSSVNLLTALTSGIFNLFLSLIFSIYLVMSKERLQAQGRRLQTAFLKPKTIRRMNVVLQVANESFSGFITSQCTEAVLLGSLCLLGMRIFGFPYATPVGVFVGITSFVPFFGAYLGMLVGVLLILAIDPIKALLFVVFIAVLQQLEGNLIYPRMVGNSIGMPGIWVFAAVILGGGLFGVPGMMLGVPFAATIYKLLRMKMHKKLEEKVEQEEPTSEISATEG